ncbi:MAG: glycosyltransferase [Acidobacteriaceae bacterium]|nr:glycosyltransferase [Acidobacteriaceae bacterium]
MKIVVFGLSISSAWGNGHATLLRGLFRALHHQGHELHFFEKDVPYYALHRDASTLPFVNLHLYSDWNQNLHLARRELSRADAGIVTSYCPDGAAACDLILNSRLVRTVFYDMDTPVTLSRLDRGESVPYIPNEGLGGFDLVLSYTGGPALNLLREQLSARCVSTLYGWVDPDVHHRVEPCDTFAADLSYLGTYSADRQKVLEQLFITPAIELQDYGFVIGGAMYPDAVSWPANIRYYDHVAPPAHSSFYSSSPLTLSVTRAAMAALGYCPSGRLFEAAACGTAVLSDWWTGLDTFFEPDEEILIASDTADSLAAITGDRAQSSAIGARAKERALSCHTADVRARRLIDLIETPTNETDQAEEHASVSGGA